jgi:hypothetical protein
MMDARTYFLMLHEHAHARGKAARVFSEATPDKWRVVLPGHNSIAWIVWHVARGEDWCIAVLQGGEQLQTRDGWDRRMGVLRRDFGTGMTTAEMAELSAVINLEALRRYWDAVYAETRRFAQRLDFDALKEPVDEAFRGRAMGLLGEWAEPMRATIERWTTGYPFLNVLALLDVSAHFDEADHVIRMLSLERQLP